MPRTSNAKYSNSSTTFQSEDPSDENNFDCFEEILNCQAGDEIIEELTAEDEAAIMAAAAEANAASPKSDPLLETSVEDAGGPNFGNAPSAEAPVSKNRKRRRRRSDSRDKKSVTIFDGYTSDVRDRSERPLVDELNTTPNTSSIPLCVTPKEPESLPTPVNDNDRRGPPPWCHAASLVKFTAYMRAIASRGGFAFSLNFGPKLQKAANDNAAAFKAAILKEIRRQVRNRLGEYRDVAFTLEVTGRRVHVHGGIVGNGNDLPALMEALQPVGGEWASDHHRAKQIDLRPLVEPDGWARYCLKGRALTRRALQIKNVISVSRDCRAEGERLWEEARKLTAQ